SKTSGWTSSFHPSPESSKWAARQEKEVNANEAISGSDRNSGTNSRRLGHSWTSIGAKIGRDFEDVLARQPGEHVDPRGGDGLRRRADDGRLQQSRNVRPARPAEQPAIDRAGFGHWLVMERGGDRADLAAARRRPLAGGKP